MRPGDLALLAMLDSGDNQEIVLFQITARAQDLAQLQWLLEASEGVGTLTARPSGQVVVWAPVSQRESVGELLADAAAEWGIQACEWQGSVGADANQEEVTHESH